MKNLKISNVWSYMTTKLDVQNIIYLIGAILVFLYVMNAWYHVGVYFEYLRGLSARLGI